MKFLGVQPVFWQDWCGMACFAVAALMMGAPWWLAVFIGAAAWRSIA